MAGHVNTRMLDVGSLPILQLAALARRESHRPRPVYTAHKWFARRFGTAMRGLLVASTLDDGDDFWAAFHGTADMSGTTVADLFIGGGTSLYEAHRLGANVVGADIDPVACMVTRFELDAHQHPDPTTILEEVVAASAAQRRLYRTIGPAGDDREALHYFWVQTVSCQQCTERFDAHPNWQVALDGKMQWVLCSGCGDLDRIPTARKTLTCGCGTTTRLAAGPLDHGKATCPSCGHREALIEIARRTGRPEFRMFAIESVPDATTRRPVPIRDRVFHAPTAVDLGLYAEAAAELEESRHLLPQRIIPTADRSDIRLTAYGHTRYTDLFNERQLLHLLRLIDIIEELDPEQRPAYAMAMSNHLTSNCMLTRYSAKWRQVTPLFSLRSFAHSARPVELNPWLQRTGRGTYPNAVRKVAAAIEFAKTPRELTVDGFVPVPSRAAGATARVINGDSRSLVQVADGSADLILTDPPYLDNIDYSELADFFVPWLAATGMLKDPGGPSPASLATKKRDADSVETFREGLTDCLREGARILRHDGRLVFTFQHRSAGAWAALSDAMQSSGLEVVNVFPMRGDSDTSFHRHENSTTWDAVFILRHAAVNPRVGIAGDQHVTAALAHAAEWATNLELGGPDHENMQRAVIAAAGAGFLRPKGLAPVLITRDVLDALPSHAASRGEVDSATA